LFRFDPEFQILSGGTTCLTPEVIGKLADFFKGGLWSGGWLIHGDGVYFVG
jgi:hypothetical protein